MCVCVRVCAFQFYSLCRPAHTPHSFRIQWGARRHCAPVWKAKDLGNELAINTWLPIIVSTSYTSLSLSPRLASSTLFLLPCRYFHLLQRPLSSLFCYRNLAFFSVPLHLSFSPCPCFCVIKSHFIAMPECGPSSGRQLGNVTRSRKPLCGSDDTKHSIFFFFFGVLFLGFLVKFGAASQLVAL